MTLHQSEAIVLRTWPLRESDLLVSLLTRDLGKVRGVAKAALKSRKRFGGTLEPMTYVHAAYAERPRQELVRMDHFEAITSPLAEPIDYLRAATLGYYAEVLENVLPDHDPQDAIFRLTLAVLEQSQVDRCWMPVTYFSLWITRLIGWLPETDRCTDCGQPFAGEAAYFLGGDSLALAQQMLRDPIRAMSDEPWTRQSGRDLRRFLVRTLERHTERHLNSADVFNRMGG